MYIPEPFKASNPDHAAALISAHPFGMLVTVSDGAPYVSHLPMLFERTAARQGKLRGHMARANPQWRHFSSDSEILAVFQGPHAYISSSYYATPGVPTWNYSAVHLRGIPRLTTDKTELADLVEQLTRVHESHMPIPWQPDRTDERQAKLLDAIVGFEIVITDIQAKFKLSQNRSLEDRQLVIAALNQSGLQTDAELAQLMAQIMLDAPR
ncbi:MAG: FMN-binding negative transcriptional regulator [Sulfuriferula sp.]|nr:FMN-binding negative transcriptional regulator [Sulfuriferula sp.]